MNKERFCPDWLFKIIISQSVYDYIVRDIELFISARKFISFFSKYYDQLSPKEIEAGAIAFIEFLGEVKAKDPFLLINHFVYSIIIDVKPNEKRLFKKDAYDYVNQKNYSSHSALKDFKIFSYSCRAGLTKKAPSGWDLTNEEGLGLISEVINKDFSIDDMIDSVT